MNDTNKTTEAKSSEQPRVLVVDDSTVIRTAIKKMLTTADFQVELAEDGEAGWDKLIADDQIKLLVTDIDMPRLDGYGFICRIRASDNGRVRDLPIITITGAEDEETKARAYACGATDFITKPLDRLQLQARAHAYVKYDETARVLTQKSVALEDQAALDPVTQLASRRYFIQKGEQDLSYALRHGQDLTLIRLDIDNFKAVYRQHGDDAVDEILIGLATTLRENARTEDTVARTGGAEFALLLPSTSLEQANALCERLRARIAAQAHAHNGAAISITASMGLVTLDEKPGDTLDALVKLAEQRLRRAKSEGGNRVSVSGLNETIQKPEEVVLVAPEPPPAEEQAEATVMETVVPFTLDEPMDDIVMETPDTLPAAGASAELIGIDMVLQALAKGEGEKVEPYLEALVRRLAPLLEAYLRTDSRALAPLAREALASLHRK